MICSQNVARRVLDDLESGLRQQHEMPKINFWNISSEGYVRTIAAISSGVKAINYA